MNGTAPRLSFLYLVPENCSHELRRFIEALFITHAETHMNTIGRITHQGLWPTGGRRQAMRRTWFETLVRR